MHVIGETGPALQDPGKGFHFGQLTPVEDLYAHFGVAPPIALRPIEFEQPELAKAPAFDAEAFMEMYRNLGEQNVPDQLHFSDLHPQERNPKTLGFLLLSAVMAKFAKARHK